MLYGIGSLVSIERLKGFCFFSFFGVKEKMLIVNRIGKVEGEERYEMEGWIWLLYISYIYVNIILNFINVYNLIC